MTTDDQPAPPADGPDPTSFRARWSAPFAQDQPDADVPPTVLDSKPCLACGYDLKGLASAGTCPECNSPIIRSLRGNLLRYASLPYLKSLRQGAMIIELSYVASVLLAVLGAATAIVLSGVIDVTSFGRAGEVIAAALEALAAFIGLFGWWIFSSPDPGLVGEDTGTSARKVLRIALVCAAIVALLKASLLFVPGFSSALRSAATAATQGGTGGGGSGYLQLGSVRVPINTATVWQGVLLGAIGFLGLLLTVTKFFASMLYLRAIVRRMPDPDLEAHVKRFTWLGPVLSTVGVVLCGLGPLIAFIMSWIIIDKARVHLGTIINQHVDGAAAADGPSSV